VFTALMKIKYTLTDGNKFFLDFKKVKEEFMKNKILVTDATVIYALTL